MATNFVTCIDRSEDSYALGKKLASRCQEKLGEQVPDIVLVFASSTNNLAELLKGVREISKEVPLTGCSTSGEMTEDGYASNGASCAFIKSDTHKFQIGLGTNLKADMRSSVSQAIKDFPGKLPEYPHRSAIMLIDGLTGRGEEAVTVASALLDSDFNFAGGAAADNLKLESTQVFYNGEIHSNAVVLCQVNSKKELTMAALHAHVPISKPLRATKVDRDRLYEVDGRNAWEVWKEMTKEKREKLGFTDAVLDKGERLGAFLLEFELGLQMDETTYKLRAPLSKHDDGSLGLVCGIPEGARFRIMQSDMSSQLSLARKVSLLASEDMEHNVSGAIIFDCACRGAILGEQFYGSVQGCQEALGAIPLIGFKTYGEICMRPNQFSGFHNTTSVVLLFPD